MDGGLNGRTWRRGPGAASCAWAANKEEESKPWEVARKGRACFPSLVSLAGYTRFTYAVRLVLTAAATATPESFRLESTLQPPCFLRGEEELWRGGMELEDKRGGKQASHKMGLSTTSKTPASARNIPKPNNLGHTVGLDGKYGQFRSPNGTSQFLTFAIKFWFYLT